MVNDVVFEKIIEDKERTFVLTNSCTPKSIFTWSNVESYINNNYHNSDIVIIGDNKSKIETYRSTETSSTPTKTIASEIYDGKSFILNAMERYTKGLFYASNIFSQIQNRYVSTNIYGGLKNTSKSFHAHADSQYVLILQLDGISDWTVYAETWNGNPNEVICLNDDLLKKDLVYTLHPGDVLYIPYRRYHKCIPRSKRLSASISADFGTVRPSHYGDWFGFN